MPVEPQYSLNTAKVGIKHQSINYYFFLNCGLNFNNKALMRMPHNMTLIKTCQAYCRFSFVVSSIRGYKSQQFNW
jgi:hypothetical protein